MGDASRLQGELPPGTVVGRYQVVRPLGAGGMADLYLVRASGIEGFEKFLALKRIRPEHANDGEFIRMFLDEARLAATLHHPNIAQVFDIGTVEGNYFFTMEYVEGRDLLALIKAAKGRGERVPLQIALTVVAGVAAALHYAHERKAADGQPLEIVHRDVSPSNILVSWDGAVKLVDFGIAKATRRTAVTRVGSVKGKIAYMSPEQCTGKRVDRRSDVYSLGMVLHELTTGARAFDAENDLALAHRIGSEDVPAPSPTHPDYPRPLEEVLLRALRREALGRYPTAQDFQLALEAFASSERLALSPIALASYVQGLFPAAARAPEIHSPAPDPTPRTASLPGAGHLASTIVERRRGLVRWVGAGGLALAAAASAWAVLTRSEPAPTAPAPAPASPTSAAAPAPAPPSSPAVTAAPAESPPPAPVATPTAPLPKTRPHRNAQRSHSAPRGDDSPFP